MSHVCLTPTLSDVASAQVPCPANGRMERCGPQGPVPPPPAREREARAARGAASGWGAAGAYRRCGPRKRRAAARPSAGTTASGACTAGPAAATRLGLRRRAAACPSETPRHSAVTGGVKPLSSEPRVRPVLLPAGGTGRDQPRSCPQPQQNHQHRDADLLPGSSAATRSRPGEETNPRLRAHGCQQQGGSPSTARSPPPAWPLDTNLPGWRPGCSWPGYSQQGETSPPSWQAGKASQALHRDTTEGTLAYSCPQGGQLGCGKGITPFPGHPRGCPGTAAPGHEPGALGVLQLLTASAALKNYFNNPTQIPLTFLLAGLHTTGCHIEPHCLSQLPPAPGG